MAKEKESKTEEQTLPKKSDLIQEQIDLEKQYEDGSALILEDEYAVQFGSKAAFERMIKYVEKDVEFDYSTATGLALLHSNLKQQKPFTKEDDWDGRVMLKTSSCLVLWKIITSYKGRGFFEAREFLSTIQSIGPDLSKSVKTINDKQASLRGLHTRLNEIYNILDSGKFENDLTKEEEEEMIKKSKQIIEQENLIEEEVNPEVD